MGPARSARRGRRHARAGWPTDDVLNYVTVYPFTREQRLPPGRSAPPRSTAAAPEGAQEAIDPVSGVPVRGRSPAAQSRCGAGPRSSRTRAWDRCDPARPTPADPRLTAVTLPVPQRDVGPDAGASGEEAVDAEREADEARARLRRGRMITAGVAAVLVVVVAVVALLGGFERRTDLITPVAVGSVITTGPYEITLTSATVQHRSSEDTWDVVARGTARTTGTTSIAPGTGDNGFLYAKDLGTGESQAVRSVDLGESTSYEHLEYLTPGLPAVPVALTFRFTAQPGGSILLAVFQQEYTTPYLFSDELGWRATAEASTMTLPLERLPDTEY